MKKFYKKILKANNAVDPATSTSRNFGFGPISGKGGKTTNATIPSAEEMSKRKKGVKDDPADNLGQGNMKEGH